MVDLNRMTVEEKLSNVPGWIGAVLSNALEAAAAANGGQVPEEALIRAMKIAAAFGVLPSDLTEHDDDDQP